MSFLMCEFSTMETITTSKTIIAARDSWDLWWCHVGNHDPFLRRISFEKKKKGVRKKVTAFSSLNQIEKWLFLQVWIIDLVYHLIFHNKLPKTFSFQVRYSNSFSVYENPQKRVGKKESQTLHWLSCQLTHFKKCLFCTSPNCSCLSFIGS